MRGQVLVILLLSSSLSACTSVAPMERQVDQAFQEREAAYARLEKAVATFCLARHASTEARYNCMVENRLELLRIRQMNDKERTLIRTSRLPPLTESLESSWTSAHDLRATWDRADRPPLKRRP